jgi:hypothetical protein
MGHNTSVTLEDLTDFQLYKYQKECTLLSQITSTTSIRGPGGILQIYDQGQLHAAEYHCIGEMANTLALQDVLLKEWLWWGVQYNTWKNISTTSKSRSHTQVNQGVPMGQLKDDPCGTPVECYMKAIKALQEAEQKILTIQTGLINLNKTVTANQKEVKTNMSIYNRIISNHTIEISANTDRFSTLTSYPCGCMETRENAPLTYCSYGVTQGFSQYCITSSCGSHIYGIICCELCIGTSEEAAAYALANPTPPGMKYQAMDTPRDQAEV